MNEFENKSRKQIWKIFIKLFDQNPDDRKEYIEKNKKELKYHKKENVVKHILIFRNTEHPLLYNTHHHEFKKLKTTYGGKAKEAGVKNLTKRQLKIFVDNENVGVKLKIEYIMTNNKNWDDVIAFFPGDLSEIIEKDPKKIYNWLLENYPHFVKTKILLFNSERKNISKKAKLEIYKFIEQKGGDDYALILNDEISETDKIVKYNELNVPIRNADAPDIMYYDDNGKLKFVNHDESKRGICVPEYLKKHCNVFEKKSIEFIIKELQYNWVFIVKRVKEKECSIKELHFCHFCENNKVISLCENEWHPPMSFKSFNQIYDVERDGVSILQLEATCAKKRINMRIIDANNHMFYKFPPNKEENENKNKNNKCLMFVLYDGHIYHIDNKEIRESMKNRNGLNQIRNEITDNRREKNILKNKIKNHQEFMGFDHAYDKIPFEPLTLVTTKSDEIFDMYVNERLYNNKEYEFKTKGDEMVELKIAPNIRIVKQICEILKRPFNNETFYGLAKEIFSSTTEEPMFLQNFKSHFNEESYKFCNDITIGNPIVETFYMPCNKKNIICYDVVKCFSHMLENLEQDIVFNVLDEVKDYDGISPIRLDTIYYCEPKKGRGSELLTEHGTYYPQLIIRGLENGIITKNDIKYSLKGKLVSARGQFSKFVKYCYSTFPEKISKTLVNVYIGGLGHTKETIGSVSYGTDINSMASKNFHMNAVIFILRNSKTYFYIKELQ